VKQEPLDELAAEDRTQGFDMEEEAFAGWDPAGMVEGESATGKQAVEVEVAFELLIPGVEDEGKGWGAVEVAAGEFQQGLRDRFEQEVQ